MIKLARQLLNGVNLKNEGKVTEILSQYAEYYANQMDNSSCDYCKYLLTIWGYIKLISFDELNIQLNSIIIFDGVIKFGSIHVLKEQKMVM